MQIHLIAPPDLIPLIAARLAFNPPSSSYCLQPNHPHQTQIPTGDLIIAIQSPSSEQVTRLQQKNPHIIDALLAPAPLAPTHGFITLASGSIENLNLASDLLNCLSPISNGWLHVGALGACGFLNQLWLALITPQGTPPFLDWRSQLGEFNKKTPLNHVNVVAQLATLMAQQQLQTQTLASLSRNYLAQNPKPEIFQAHHAQASNLFGLFANGSETTPEAPARQLAKLFAQY